jgi:hypothetical protein
MDIIKEIGEVAVVEQLAESCSALAYHASQLAKIMRGENPTAVHEQTAKELTVEKISDTLNCIMLLRANKTIYLDSGIEVERLKHWEKRIKQKKGKV